MVSFWQTSMEEPGRSMWTARRYLVLSLPRWATDCRKRADPALTAANRPLVLWERIKGGLRIAALENDGSLVVIDRSQRSGPSVLHRFPNAAVLPASVAMLAISPDGQSLFLNRSLNEALKVDLTLPGEPIVETVAQDTPGLSNQGFTHPRLSPDGARIAYANGRILRTSDLLQVGELLDRARDAGIGIRDLATSEADLEELFLRLTGGESAVERLPAEA